MSHVVPLRDHVARRATTALLQYLIPMPDAYTALQEALYEGGDPIEAWIRVPFMMRAATITAFHAQGLHSDKWKSCLGITWVKDYTRVHQACQAWGVSVVRLFQAARFQIPDTLPDPVICWRGVAGINTQKARAGFSWTTDRRAACWISCGLLQNGGFSPKSLPLVIKRVIPRSQILFYEPQCHDDGRPYDEVVAVPGGSGERDGDEREWVSEASKWKEEYIDRLAGWALSDTPRQHLAEAFKRLAIYWRHEQPR